MEQKINEKEIKKMDEKSPTGHFDRKGNEIGIGTCAKLLEDKKYRIIKQEVIKVGKKIFFVSTVWLGINHNLSEVKRAKRLIFETMIFEKTKIGIKFGDSIYTDRYSTEKEAVDGHKKAVSLLKLLK